jgi:anti-sigma B factor antagonist
MVQIDITVENEISSLLINGDVDASSSIQLDDALKKTIADGAVKIIIGCENLNYISSAGLGVFMSYIEDIKTKGIRMALYGLNDKVMNVFEILGLDQLLNIVSTKKDAIASISEA